VVTANNNQLGLTTRWVLVAFLIVIGAIAFWLVRDIMLLLLASVILAVLVSAPIRFFLRRGVPHNLAVVISLLLMLVVVVLAVLLVVPGLVEQFVVLARIIPQAIEQVQEFINSGQLNAQFPALAQLLAQIDLTSLGPILEQLGGVVQNITSALFPFLGGIANTLVGLIVVLFMSLYFITDPELYQQGVIKLVPIPYRPRAQQILERLDLTLRGFLQAKLTSMLLMGVGTFIGLSLLGIPLAPALGTINGVFSFVPNFGPLVALIPTLAVAIVNAPERWPWVILLIYGLSLVESQFIGPWLMSEQIKLPPVLVLVGQIVAGIFLGFMGLLLAVPLTAMVMVLVEEIYVKDILGDREIPAAHRPDTLEPDGV